MCTFEEQQAETLLYLNKVGEVMPEDWVCIDARIDEGETYSTGQHYHGTSAAIEYAVTALGVTNLIVMGHTLCGGIQGCHDMCSGKAPELEKTTSFVGRWINILRPTYEEVASEGGTDEEQVKRLEQKGILTSIENLMTFPFISERVEAKQLSLHAVILDISEGTIKQFDESSSCFVPV